MTLRAVIVGIVLALLVSCFTYFNDEVIQGARFIGTYLPISVFGIVLMLLLVLNPIIRKRSLSKREIAVVLVFGLVVCGYAGSGFYRLITSTISMPLHQEKSNTSWQASNVMSYVPGGSPLVAQGQVRDWQALAEKVTDPGDNKVARRVKNIISTTQLQSFEDAAEVKQPSSSQINIMTEALNSEVIESPPFYQPEVFAGIEFNETARKLLKKKKGSNELSDFQLKQFNRALLVSSFPDLIQPPPEGKGLMLSMGKDGRKVLDTLFTGSPQDDPRSLWDIPWHVWWPNIVFWGSMALTLGMAALCLALIVHQQWSSHEMLAYPIPRFIELVSDRESGGWLPTIARDKMFWIALGIVFGIRLLNGTAAYFDGVPEFPLQYSLQPLQDLFPNASQMPARWGAFNILLIPAIIGFAFFLRTEITFTVGISTYLWLIFGSFFIARGVPVDWVPFGAGGSNMLRFGAYLGMVMIILYTGRHYYAKVAGAGIGLSRTKETPKYAVWAARGLAISFVVGVFLLSKFGGMSAFWAVLFLLLVMTIYLVVSRIVSETGIFWVNPLWVPVGVLTGLFGFEAIGPTSYIVMGVVSTVFFGAARTLLMPFFTTALKVGEIPGRLKPGRLAPWMAGIIFFGFIAAGAATMYIQHDRGLNFQDGWAIQTLPKRTFNRFAENLSDVTVPGVLSDITAQSTFERLSNFAPKDGVYGWMILGIALFLLTALARLRLSWWPIHPVIFLIWGTWPFERFASPFLIGWAIKVSVLKIMGTAGYHKLKPLMVGLIAGDLLAALFWVIIGLIYYFATGMTPEAYSLLP